MANSVFGKRVKYSTVPYRYRESGEGTLIQFISVQHNIKAVVLKEDGSFVSASLDEISLCAEESKPIK